MGIKQVWASMGKNVRISQSISKGRSYFRWTATGAALGAVKGGADNLFKMGDENRTPFMTSVKRGAIMGAAGRTIKGVRAGQMSRRELRGRGA